jgi:hypothetical protein
MEEVEQQKAATSPQLQQPQQHGASASHAYISDAWDAAIDTTLRKVVYGTLSGAVAGLILCRGGSARAAAAAFGAGFGAGSAYHENQELFDKAFSVETR